VRNTPGKVLGLFNGLFFQEGMARFPIANFALARDRLVVLALRRLCVVRLGEVVVGEERCDAVGC
jgi:hypothetical protein